MSKSSNVLDSAREVFELWNEHKPEDGGVLSTALYTLKLVFVAAFVFWLVAAIGGLDDEEVSH